MNLYKRIHFIGIGGIGISALARFYKHMGANVSGSDSQESPLIKELVTEGIQFLGGHRLENITSEIDLVIYTEAIDQQVNPEFIEAKKLNLKTVSYFAALGEISKSKKTIAIAGTHGKTTTTAMLGQALVEAGVDPTVIVGSKVKAFGGKNIYFGKSEWLVIEACEYRRSFLNLHPFGLILLNSEVDHLDYYKNEADYLNAYQDLIKKVNPNGFIVYNASDKNLNKLIKASKAQVIPAYQERSTDLKLKVPGDFNQLNAEHARQTALKIGGNPKKIKEGLENFEGTWRRLDKKGLYNGAIIIDDYGHHPTEIRVTLKAIKNQYKEKEVICVFQPHQYSRTHQLADEFSTCFSDADHVMITDIYAARDTEEDRQKINAEKLVGLIKKHHSNVMHSGDLENTIKVLKEIATNSQIIITMGAGDIFKVSETLLK